MGDRYENGVKKFWGDHSKWGILKRPKLICTAVQITGVYIERAHLFSQAKYVPGRELFGIFSHEANEKWIFNIGIFFKTRIGGWVYY